MMRLAVSLAALLLAAPALAETPPIGPEEPVVVNNGFTHSDWRSACAANSSANCGTNANYGTPAAGDEGKLRFICDPSHLSYDDPIVYPGQQGLAHLHHFFGNPGTNYASTYASLRSNTTPSTCDGGPLNNTAYWFPAMINGGQNKVQVPDFIELYYNTQRETLTDYLSPLCADNGGWPYYGGPQIVCTTPAVRRMERGLKYIMGHLASSGLNPTGYPNLRETGQPTVPFTWSCGGVGAKAVFWDDSNNANGVQSCAAGTGLQVRLEAPNCWNGAYDSADHFSHMSYTVGDMYGRTACPATHPYRMIALTIIISWSHNGQADYSTWYLSSDRFNGATHPAGKTFHTDWFGAWDDETQDGFHQEINGMFPNSLPYSAPTTSPHVRESVDGGLGNGFALKNDLTSITALGEPARYLDIPVNTSTTPTRKGRSRGRMR
jgi:hypothetical protein